MFGSISLKGKARWLELGPHPPLPLLVRGMLLCCGQRVAIENSNSKFAVPSPSTRHVWRTFLHLEFNIMGLP